MKTAVHRADTELERKQKFAVTTDYSKPSTNGEIDGDLVKPPVSQTLRGIVPVALRNLLVQRGS